MYNFLLEHEVPSGGVVAIGAARPSAMVGHRQARAARGRKKEALGCNALLLQVRSDWAWYKALFGFKGWASKEICWRCKANFSDIPWTTPRAPRHGGRPDTAHRSCWRARPSKDQCQPSVLFAWVFGRAHLHRCVALDGPGHDARRDWKCVFRSGSAIHCPRRQVLLTYVANLNSSFAPSHGLFRGFVTARCLFILALSTFCGTSGFPLFCTSVGFHPSSSRLEFSFASCWQRVVRNRHRNRKMMTRNSSRCT